MLATVARFDLSPQLQRNTAGCATLYERRKKWFMVFFKVEPSDDGGRSRHTLVAKHNPRLRPSLGLGLGLALVIAKLISYV